MNEPRFVLDDGQTLFTSGKRGRRSYWIDYAAPIDAAVSANWTAIAKGTPLRLVDDAFSEGCIVKDEFKKRAAALTAAFRKLLVNREGYVPQVIIGQRKDGENTVHVLLLRYKRGIRRS